MMALVVHGVTAKVAQEDLGQLEISSLQSMVVFLHPLMLPYIREGHALTRVGLQKATDQILRGGRYVHHIKFDVTCCLADLEEMACAAKGKCSTQECVEDGAQAPKVYAIVMGETLVDFWSVVGEPTVLLVIVTSKWTVAKLGVVNTCKLDISL